MTAAVHEPLGRSKRLERAGAVRAQHLPSLDGVRAVAFLLVFLAHAGLEDRVPGGFGVTVFFFLSGYLITTLLRMEHDTTGTISLRQFYLRRALRILPPFYLVLGLAVAAAQCGLIAGGWSREGVAALALQLGNYRIAIEGYRGLPAGTGVYWSLAVEEHFYLVFPLLYMALRRSGLTGRGQALTLWVACGLVLAWRWALVHSLHASADRVGLATDARIDSILFGCALAVHGNPALDGAGRVSERAWKWVWLPGSLAMLAFTFVYRDPAFRLTARYTLQGIGLYAPMIVALRFPTWAPARLLNSTPVAWVGVLSYVLYLAHHVILNAVDAHLAAPPWWKAGVALAIALGVAWLTHQAVEKPCAEVRKRWSPVVSAPRLAGSWQPRRTATT